MLVKTTASGLAGGGAPATGWTSSTGSATTLCPIARSREAVTRLAGAVRVTQRRIGPSIAPASAPHLAEPAGEAGAVLDMGDMDVAQLAIFARPEDRLTGAQAERAGAEQ